MLNTAYYLAFILVFFRLSGFFMILPVFFPSGTPNMVKIGFTAILTFMILPGIKYGDVNSINNNFILLTFCINEILTGIILGFLTNLCFYMAQMAGQLMDFQVGFAMMSMFDPMSKENVTLLGRLLYWVSLIIFLIIDGHHMMIRALIESYNALHIGKFLLTQESLTMIFATIFEFFNIGVKIAIPIILVILITDISLSLMGRVVPQLNIMILGMPIKIFIGLSSFILALPVFIKILTKTFYYIPNILESLYKIIAAMRIDSIFSMVPIIPIVIIFGGDSGDKTEEATPKKKSEARKKGQVAKSKEVAGALTLLAVTFIFVILGSYIMNSLKSIMTLYISNYMNISLNYNTVKGIFITSLIKIGMIFLPVVLPIMLMGIIANFMQAGFLFTKDPLKPDFKKLNPISGFKKIFSMRSVVDLIKNIAVITIIGIVAYNFVKSNYRNILNMGNLRNEAIVSVFGDLVRQLFFKVTIIMIIIAVLDFAYQKFKHTKELKMSKQEIKEEFKQQEGDPQIKGKIRQKQREMASGRMMKAVPDATVVITNPTHIAIALKYDGDTGKAPMVVAKGIDNIAIKIKEIAKENDVPIIENKPLARLIYKEVDLDSEINADMYQAVAEIIALVYKLKKRK